MLLSRCDCCGLSVAGGFGEDCPRCGYPLLVAKEQQFLQRSIGDLQRVAQYGGGSMSVLNLLARYSGRLHYLGLIGLNNSGARTFSSPAPASTSEIVSVPPHSRVTQPLPSEEKSAQTFTPGVQPQAFFFWHSFLSDNAISIVALLGAFLILVGALSFVATTADQRLTFAIILGLHLCFGGAALVISRVPGLNFVSKIYLSVYALLLPLVAYTFYTLFLIQATPLSLPTIIFLAAIYAAVAYSAIAITQEFEVFAYVGAVSWMVADLALVVALKLDIVWSIPLALTFAVLALWCSHLLRSNVLPDSWRILGTPLRLVSYGILGLSIVACVQLLQMAVLYSSPFSATRFSLVTTLLLISGYTALLLWVKRNHRQLLWLPVLALCSVLTLSFACDFDASGYSIALTLLALAYAGLHWFVGRSWPLLRTFNGRLNLLILLIFCFLPFLADPKIPLYLFNHAYRSSFLFQSFIFVPWESRHRVAFGVFLVGLILTVRVVWLEKESHPVSAMLPAGYLLFWNYSLCILVFGLDPLWLFLGLSFGLAIASVIVRQSVGSRLADPLDGIVLIAQTLVGLLCLRQPGWVIGLLFFSFAVFDYGILVYQRRSFLYWVPAGWSLLALFFWPIWAVWCIALLLPMITALVARLYPGFKEGEGKQGFSWDLLPLGIGIVYAAVIYNHDLLVPFSLFKTLGWSPAVEVDLALIGLSWYLSALLTRAYWWAVPAICFGALAFSVSASPILWLAGVSAAFALIAYAVSQGSRRDFFWIVPLYAIALIGALIASVRGFEQNQLQAVSWILPGLGLLTALLSWLEAFPLAVWLLPIFSAGSILAMFDLHDYSRLLILTLISLASGVTLRLARSLPFAREQSRLVPALYLAALIGAVGISGFVSDLNQPFVGAIPITVLVFAILAYGLAVFERRVSWLIFCAGFAVWGSFRIIAVFPGCGSLIADFVRCSGPNQTILISLTVLVVIACTLAWIGRWIRRQPVELFSVSFSPQFWWSWPWYLLAGWATLLTLGWQLTVNGNLYELSLISAIVLGLAGLVIVLVERQPSLLLIPVGIAVFTLARLHLGLPQILLAFDLLWFLIFCMQPLWRRLRPDLSWDQSSPLHHGLAFLGLIGVLIVVFLSGGISSEAGDLAQVGVGTLVLLIGLLTWYAKVQPVGLYKTSFMYCAGLLGSLAISWELLVFHQTRIDILTLVPASYLIVIAPFLLRDDKIAEHRQLGKVTSLVGAGLLLLPTLWLSYSEVNLLPTLILVIEAFVLLLLGLGTHLRIFVLSGFGLLILGILRALFLPSSGLSLPVSLTLVGVLFLVFASFLRVLRQRFWTPGAR